jgi:AcrR family transcriptional regulator
VTPRPHIDHIRKPQLLAAAAEVIAERGLAATRIADVADRVGASSGAVLYWFASKDELLAEALIADEERFAAELVVGLAEVQDPAAKLLRLIDACVEDNNWSLWIEIWGRARHDERLRRARQELDDGWRALIARIVRDGIAEGTFSPANGDEAALALAALIDGLAVQVTLADATISRGFMREICVEAADRLLDADLRAVAREPASA